MAASAHSAALPRPTLPVRWRPALIPGVPFFILSAFGLWLVLGPVLHEADIVAAVFCSALGLIVLAFGSGTIVGGARIRRSLEVECSSPAAPDGGSAGRSKLVARSELPWLIKVSPVSIWPLFVLRVRFEFEEGALPLSLHLITGLARVPRYLREPIVFPHRGTWRIRRAHLEFGDQLGFFTWSWELTTEQVRRTSRIRPPVIHESSAPILSSCQRVGDTLTDHRERQGDLFDLKPYHPSDGMKRIVWKIFARRGELIARQPEASMTPEGQVALFVLARPEDDDVAGSLRAYVERLEEHGLDIFVGCEGMGGRPLGRDHKTAEDLLIETVWDARISTEASIRRDVDEMIRRLGQSLGEGTLTRLIIFCSVRRLDSAEAARLYCHLGESLSARYIEPVFILIDSTMAAAADPGVRRRQGAHAESFRRDFFTSCARSGWDTVMVQV